MRTAHRTAAVGALLCALLLGLSVRVFSRHPCTFGLYDDPDSYTFTREARLIYAGRLTGRFDTRRWYPEGRDLSRMQLLWSNTQALSARVFTPMLGARAFPVVARYSSVFAFLACLLPYFVLLDRLLGRREALAATMLVSVWPVCFPRSCVGYADRDAFCLLLGLVGYAALAWSWTAPWRRALLLQLAAGLAFCLLGYAWEGYGLFTAIAALHGILCMPVREWPTAEIKPTAPVWCLGALLPIATCPAFHNLKPYTLLAAAPPAAYLGTWAAAAWQARLRPAHWFAFRRPRVQPRVAAGALVLSVVAVTALAARHHSFGAGAVGSLADWVVSPLGHSRLTETVAELATVSLVGWLAQLGTGCIALAVGLPLLCYRVFPTSSARHIAAIGSAAFVAILLGANLSSQPTTPNDDWTRGTRAVALGILAAAWFASLAMSRPGEAADAPERQDFLFVYLWAVVLLAATAGTVRFMLFLALPVAALGAWLAFLALDIAARWLDRRAYQALCALTLVLGASALAACSAQDLNAKLASDRLGPSFISSMQWARRNLPRRAVVLSTWDRGLFITELGHATTVVDAEHVHINVIEEAARRFWCANDPEAPLQFVRKYGITHVFVSDWDLNAAADESYYASGPGGGICVVPTVFGLSAPAWDDFARTGTVHLTARPIEIPGTRQMFWDLADGELEVTRHSSSSPPVVTSGAVPVFSPGRRPTVDAFRRITLANGATQATSPHGLPGVLVYCPTEGFAGARAGSAIYTPKAGFRFLIYRLALGYSVPSWLRPVYTSPPALSKGERVTIYRVVASAGPGPGGAP